MSYWVQTDKSEVMSWVSAPRVTNLEHETPEVKQWQEELSKDVDPRLSNEEFIAGRNAKPGDWHEDLNYDPDFQEEFNKAWGDEDIKEADEQFTPEVFDVTYLNMELILPHKESQSWDIVT